MNHGATTPNGVPPSITSSHYYNLSSTTASTSYYTSYIQTTSNGHLVHHLPHPPLISHIHHQQPTYERLNNNNINNNNIVINQQPQRLPINLVDGQQPSPQILTLHVTIPNSSTQQQHILHLPQSALPQHIIVQRQPPSHVEPILNQLHHSNFAVHQNHSYRPNGKLQGASCSSTGSIKSGNSNSRCTSSSNVSPPLTEEQAQRRRRNAERSRRRRAMETPQQRAERNRRTAERMRNRRARLASERRQNRPEGVDTTTVVARQVVPLSVDRFEEIFQSVISRCTKTEVKSEMDPPVMECAPPRMSHNPFSACAGLRIVESQSSPATSQLEPHQAEPNTDRTTIIYCQQQNLGYHTTMNGGKKHVPNNRSVSPQNFEDL
uniref:BZIP domain-containing protein n=1 Tax=Ditylenchus dipsaci TaxID=166011 RepID=A0A915ESH7_9BILA